MKVFALIAFASECIWITHFMMVIRKLKCPYGLARVKKGCIQAHKYLMKTTICNEKCFLVMGYAVAEP